MFALADCNNFFVSCERVFRPDLDGKPVVVLSNNDGCAISRSNEAKALGVKMGQPLFQFRHLVAEGKLTIFSSNFLLYGDMSNRVRYVLRSAAPAVEIYSIDECFIDLNGMEGRDMDSWAKELSAHCLRDTGIPISVGVSPSKTLAKIASKLCKQYPRLRGGCALYRPADVQKVLEKFPLNDVWGIGRKYSTRFGNFGIRTAADFVAKGERWVRDAMGEPGVNTWKELQGIPVIGFEENPSPKKQIMVSRSFAKEIRDLEDLSQQVSMFCAMAVEKLRRQHSACQAAMVFAWTNRFHREDELQQYEGHLVTFPVATESTLEINSAVMAALRAIFTKGCGYKRAGVCLSEIVPSQAVQLSMFDSVDHEKHSRLMTTLDQINKREGRTAISVASQSFDGVRMNREHLSQQYTTDWSEIMIVHCGK